MKNLEAIPAILMTATRLEALRPEIEKRQLTTFEKPFHTAPLLVNVDSMCYYVV